MDTVTAASDIADFIQQYVKEQEKCQVSDGSFASKMTGEKGYQSVESRPKCHFIIGLVINVYDKTVHLIIMKAHHYQALAPLHEYVLEGLGFGRDQGCVFNYDNTEAIMHH